MPPFSIHAALGRYELAIAFGRSEPEAEEPDEPSAELMPIMSESERDMFGFARFDRPEVF